MPVRAVAQACDSGRGFEPSVTRTGKLSDGNRTCFIIYCINELHDRGSSTILRFVGCNSTAT